MKSASEMTAFIRERLEDGKHRQYGEEPVSELVHALQCATLAEVGLRFAKLMDMIRKSDRSGRTVRAR